MVEKIINLLKVAFAALRFDHDNAGNIDAHFAKLDVAGQQRKAIVFYIQFADGEQFGMGKIGGVGQLDILDVNLRPEDADVDRPERGLESRGCFDGLDRIIVYHAPGKKQRDNSHYRQRQQKNDQFFHAVPFKIVNPTVFNILKTMPKKVKSKPVADVIDHLLLHFADNGQDRPDGLMRGYPNPRHVVEALQFYLDVVIPGKFDTGALDRKKPLRAYLKDKVDRGGRILEREIIRAIPFRWKGEAASVEGKRPPAKIDIKRNAASVVDAFARRLPEVRRLVIEDIRAAYRGDPAALTYAEVKLAYPGLLAIATHRLAHELYKLNVPLVPRMMSEWIHARTGVDINPGAKIGEGFFIDHATGVVIGETTEIGNHVKIYQGVTLGARSFALDPNGNPVKHIKRHPTVEDDVVIYANATILGGDTVIGKGSMIGGNVFLMESVPPNSFIAAKHPELHIRRGEG